MSDPNTNNSCLQILHTYQIEQRAIKEVVLGQQAIDNLLQPSQPAVGVCVYSWCRAGVHRGTIAQRQLTLQQESTTRGNWWRGPSGCVYCTGGWIQNLLLNSFCNLGDRNKHQCVPCCCIHVSLNVQITLACCGTMSVFLFVMRLQKRFHAWQDANLEGSSFHLATVSGSAFLVTMFLIFLHHCPCQPSGPPYQKSFSCCCSSPDCAFPCLWVSLWLQQWV